MYRIVVEALTNDRHAPETTAVAVEVEPAGDASVRVMVTNTVTTAGASAAAGAPVPRGGTGTGTGIGRLAERVGAVGGTLTAGPAHGRGWRVTAVLPTGGSHAMTIRVVIADDQEDLRSGYRMVIDAQPDMRVVGEAADGRAAVDVARRLRPDVVLADIRMPRMDGLEVTRHLAGSDADPKIRVVVVTTFDLDEYVHAALRNGASGFLLKRSGPALLIEGVRAAVASDTLIGPQVTVQLLRRMPPAGPAGAGLAAPLTDREALVADLVAQGLTNADIATELHLAAGTVKNVVAASSRKLGGRNRVGIALWVWDHHRPAG